LIIVSINSDIRPDTRRGFDASFNTGLSSSHISAN
jgi:hypothetical protein